MAFVPTTYRVAAGTTYGATYTVPATTAVTRPTIVYRQPTLTTAVAPTTVVGNRAVVVPAGLMHTAVVPTTVRVIAPPSVAVDPAEKPEVILPKENIELVPGTELENVTLLQPGDSIEPGDIVVPGDIAVPTYGVPEGAAEERALHPASEFTKGQTVEYLSRTLHKWYRCEIVDVRGDGAVEISCKPSFWIPKARVASCIRAVNDEAPLDDGKWEVGDEVEYYSRSHRKWIPAVVTETGENGAIKLNVKPSHWCERAEQEEKVRPREGKAEAALLVTNVEISEEMSMDSVVVGPPPASSKVRAVLCWNAYGWPPLSSQGWGPIDTDKGGAVWRGFLGKAGCTDITELQNRQCTRQGIIDAIVKVGHECKPGDVFVFIYTGHGAQARGHDHHELDGMDECICTVSADGQRCTQGDWLRDDDVAGCICKHVKASTVALLVDACHSATIADFNKPIWAETNKVAFSICGCSDNQESAATGVGGVFTRSMDQASQTRRGRPCNVAEMYNHVLQTARPLQQQFPSTRTGQNISISCPEHIVPANVEWPLSYK